MPLDFNDAPRQDEIPDHTAQIHALVSGAIKPVKHPMPSGNTGQADNDEFLNTFAGLKPFQWIEPEKIPPREWIYGKHRLKGTIALTIAPGGVGKSSLVMAEAVAMASDTWFLDEWLWKGCRVAYYNLEDSMLDLQRSIIAIAKHYGVKKEKLQGRLFLNSGMEPDGSICFSKMINRQAELNEEFFLTLEREIIENRIDLLIFDPFISTHKVSENDNVAIDAIVKRLSKIAVKTNCCIELVHHTRKESGPGSIDSARGSKSLTDAVRSARILSRLEESEAKSMGAKGDYRNYFRVSPAKWSRSAPGMNQIYRLISFKLGNATNEREGDEVGVVKRWRPDPAGALADYSPDQVKQVLDRIRQGDCRQHPSARDWAGKHISEILGLDDEGDVETLKAILRQLEKNEQIKVIAKDDGSGKGNKRPFYTVV